MSYKARNVSRADYIFCLLVGSIYVHALSRAIFSATIINIGNFQLFAMGLFSIVLFIVALYNKKTMAIFLCVMIGIGLYLAFIFWQSPEYYDLHPIIEHFSRVIHMITGNAPYEPELGRTLAWFIILAFSALVVLFTCYKFNFFLLAATGVTVFIFTWGPGFSRDHFAFLLFLFVFCVLVMRRMNKSTAATLIVAPLCVAAIAVVNLNMPTESSVFVRRSINQTMSSSLEIVSDFFFEIFNPTYFSFQSTGFAGAGGRLGGPVTQNNRHVMDVTAPGGVYLAGAISNTFTGYSWIQTLEEGAVYTHGLNPGHFEMLETAASLLRNATFAHPHLELDTAAITTLGHSDLVSPTDIRRLDISDTNAFGVVGGFFFLHNYMPTSSVAINMRRQRTGTVFSPQNAWGLTFNPESNDYLPQLTFLPTGDIQAPRLMSRNSGYSFQFVNPNTQMHFIEDILRRSEAGLYASIASELNWWQRHVTFGDNIVGLENPEHFWFDRRNVVLGDSLGYWFSDIDNIEDQDIWALWFGGFDPWTDDRVPNTIASFLGTSTFGVQHMQMLVDMILYRQGATVLYQGLPMTSEVGFIPHESYLVNWLDMFATDVLAVYAAQVRENFMEVPEIVPQRVHDLTHEIIQGLDNDFDRIMAIRDYLTRFPYTLDTMPVPRGVCFVDHFLFVGQQGYCTYFASAMAIMARIAGVPSRYVEGFVLPPSRYGVTTVAVTNRMAHAWVDVYLEGFGWLKIEATPSYAFLNDPALMVAAGGPAAGSAFAPDWARAMEEAWFDWELYCELEYWMEDIWGDGNFSMGNIGSVAATDTATPAVSAQNVRNFATAIPFVILFIAIAYIFFRYAHMQISLRKLRHQGANTQTMKYFGGILDIITFNLGPLALGETPLAYGRENGKRYTFHRGSITFGDLIELYYKARYSPHAITEEERSVMEEAYYDMVARLRNAHESYQFMYLRYVRRIGAV